MSFNLLSPYLVQKKNSLLHSRFLLQLEKRLLSMILFIQQQMASADVVLRLFMNLSNPWLMVVSATAYREHWRMNWQPKHLLVLQKWFLKPASIRVNSKMLFAHRADQQLRVLYALEKDGMRAAVIDAVGAAVEKTLRMRIKLIILRLFYVGVRVL